MKHNLTAKEKFRLRLARLSLRMSDADVKIMGGMSKNKARRVIRQLIGGR